MSGGSGRVERKGGCLCGAVRYRAKGDPMFGLVCHCRFCQKRSGSAFAVVGYFRDEDIEFSGEKRLTYEHRSDESGRWLRLEFCPRCGVTVTHTTELRPGARGIAGGTFDEPGWFRIDRHIWTRSACPWVAIPDEVDVFLQGTSGTPARAKNE